MIYLLAQHFVLIGWKVDIVLLLSGVVDNQQFPLDKNISIVDMSGNKASYGRNAVYWLRSIRKYVKTKRPDCIVSFIGRINALVLSATLGQKIPILISERSDPLRDGRGKHMLKYCDLIYHRAFAIVFQTQYQLSCFSGSLKKKSFIIPNPVSVANNTTENIFEISTAGRLDAAKNHGMLIDAVKLVAERSPDIQCYIYGDGSQREYLQQRIDQLGMNNNVHLPGNKADICKWIAHSSIFVMTSEYEGLSNALVEAMMLGKACITTDYPGADEVIRNGETGVIVPRGNSVWLAEEIGRLLSSESKRKQLGENAKKAAEIYQPSKVIKAWESLIQNAVLNKQQKKKEVHT